MKSLALALVAIVALVAAGFYGWARARSLRGPQADEIGNLEPEKHKVTLQMLKAAREKAERPAPAFKAEASDGKTYDSAEILKGGSFVLIFIKDGCPCSVEAERYFNDIHAAYGGRARFFGVIDGDPKLARKWADAHGVPFPILADPKLEIVHAYGAESSAYVALIDGRGSVAYFWPGYSVEMLRDLSNQVANLGHLKPEKIETPEAPDELYSGCPF